MSTRTISRRYAGALYEEAERSSQLDAVDEDIAMIRESLEGAPELVRFFESPVISRTRKESVIKALFSERVQSTTLRFLLLMIGKGREQLFPDVVSEYQDLRDAQKGVVPVSARVATGVSEEERAHLLQTLEQHLGSKVRLSLLHDASLLGGIVIQIGDMVYDGSFQNQLKSLRERLEDSVLATN